MIINVVVKELIRLKPGDEIVIAKQKEYFEGTP